MLLLSWVVIEGSETKNSYQERLNIFVNQKELALLAFAWTSIAQKDQIYTSLDSLNEYKWLKKMQKYSF